MTSRCPFLIDEQFEILLANGMRALEQPDFDPKPVVKLFTPDAGGTWLSDYARIATGSGRIET